MTKNLTGKAVHQMGEQIPDSAWEYEGSPDGGLTHHFIHWVDREKGQFIRKKVKSYEPTLLEMNAEEYNHSLTRKFGDMPRVARVPLDLYLRDFAEHEQQGDRDYTKWWLNREENRPYRTFRGKF